MIRTCGNNAKGRTVKKLFKNFSRRKKRSFRRPRKGWLDDVENGLKEMDVKRVDKNSWD
jgi:hypothetical protein